MSGLAERRLRRLRQAMPSQELKRRTLDTAGRAMRDRHGAACATPVAVPWRFWLSWGATMILVMAAETVNVRFQPTRSRAVQQRAQPTQHDELLLLEELGVEARALRWTWLMSGESSRDSSQDQRLRLEKNLVERLIGRES